jgi:hypothetical protein
MVTRVRRLLLIALTLTYCGLGSLRIAPAPYGARAAACGVWQTTRIGEQGQLRAFAVVATSDVWAVGSVASVVSERPVLLHWDGSSWRSVVGADGDGRSTLTGIKAFSRDDAWAVGTQDELSAKSRPLIEHWDGRRWARIEDHVPAGSTISAISGVATNDLWIAGARRNRYGNNAPLLEHWDGHVWTIAKQPRYATPPTDGGDLTAIATISSRDAWAVGSKESTQLLLHWDGSGWRIVPLPKTAGPASALTDVSAATSTDVWVTGASGTSEDSALGIVPLLDHWDGTAWQSVPSPNIGEEPTSVTDVRPRNAWLAAGNIVEHWDGAAWRIVPSPSGGIDSLTVAPQSGVWGVGSIRGHNDSIVEHFSGEPCYSLPPAIRTVGLGYGVGFGPNGQADRADAMVLDASRHVAYVANAVAGSVSIVNTASVTLAHTTAISGVTALALDTSTASLYAATDDPAHGSASVVVVNARTGAPMRRLHGGKHAMAIAVDGSTRRLFVLDTIPLTGPGQSGESVGQITVLDTTTGAVVRTVAIGSPISLLIDPVANRAVVASISEITTLNASTGDVLARLPIDPYTVRLTGIALDPRTHQVVAVLGMDTSIEIRVLSPSVPAYKSFIVHTDQDPFPGVPVVDSRAGTVLVPFEGAAKVFDLLTGAERSRLNSTGGVGTPAVDERNGRIYALENLNVDHYGNVINGGTVQVFDEGTGTLLANVPVGVGPDSVAVDQGSGRVFLLSQSGFTTLQWKNDAIKSSAPCSPASCLPCCSSSPPMPCMRGVALTLPRGIS